MTDCHPDSSHMTVTSGRYMIVAQVAKEKLKEELMTPHLSTGHAIVVFQYAACLPSCQPA